MPIAYLYPILRSFFSIACLCSFDSSCVLLLCIGISFYARTFLRDRNDICTRPVKGSLKRK